MKTLSISCVIEIVYVLKNNEGYGFDANDNLYNLKTRRKIKLTLNGRSKGYWIGKQFYSLTFIKEHNLKIRPSNYNLPF